MSKIEKFEDIIAWQKSQELTLAIYKVCKNLKDYSFRDQIQRASVSVMNNIAEGFERSGDKEFNKFLYISKGSCAEVRSMLYLAVELGYISQKEFTDLSASTIVLSKLLSGFISALRP